MKKANNSSVLAKIRSEIMKRMCRALSPGLLTLFPVMAFADCKINDQVVPCDVFWAKFGWMFAVMGVVGFAAFAFMIWMLVDCVKRKPDNQALWILVIFAGNILGALAYFFAVKKKQSVSG